MKKLLLVGVAFVAMLPMTALARGRVAVFVGPAFAPYGWYGYSWYGPYGMYPHGIPPNRGEIKLDTKVKDAEVFVNGYYAGTVGKLKTMTMRSGSYNIEIRTPGQAPFHQQVYVLAGKTVKLHPDFRLETPSALTGS